LGTTVDFMTVVLVVDEVDPPGVTTTPSSVAGAVRKQDELMAASPTSAAARIKLRNNESLVKEPRLQIQDRTPKESWWPLQYL